ncbi:MAG: histidine phosphatase family protein [Hyphomicrobium sp.]
MLTLSLMRHAKSDWGDLEQNDYDRALAPRGIKAAALMGKAITRLGLKPSLVLCSGAVRTRATLALMLPELGIPPPQIRHDDQLYLALPATMLDVLVKSGKGFGTVMILAHNPGIHALALALTGSGDKLAIAGLAAKFPTAALAVLRFKCQDWRDARAGTGELTHFMSPRGLE